MNAAAEPVSAAEPVGGEEPVSAADAGRAGEARWLADIGQAHREDVRGWFTPLPKRAPSEAGQRH